MTLGELIGLYGARVGRYAEDVPRFVMAPGRYLDKVVDESRASVVARLAFYYLAFVLFEYSIFATLDWFDGPGHFEFLGTALYEALLPLAFVPVAYVVGRAAGVRSAKKRAFIFVLTFKPIYMVIPVLLYGMFLVTEDYLIALLRGVAAWGYIVGFIILYPIIVGHSAVRRFLLVALSVATLWGGGWVFSKLYELFPESDTSFTHYALMYDPIGIEYDKVVGPRDNDPGGYGDPVALVMRYIEAVERYREQNSQEQLVLFMEEIDRIKIGCARLDSLYVVERDTVLALESTLRFDTSVALVDLRLDEISSGRSVVAALNAHLEEPTGDQAEMIREKQNIFIDSSIQRLDHENSHFRIRHYLRRAMLIVDW